MSDSPLLSDDDSSDALHDTGFCSTSEDSASSSHGSIRDDAPLVLYLCDAWRGRLPHIYYALMRHMRVERGWPGTLAIRVVFARHMYELVAAAARGNIGLRRLYGQAEHFFRFTFRNPVGLRFAPVPHEAGGDEASGGDGSDEGSDAESSGASLSSIDLSVPQPVSTVVECASTIDID
jgi:hypothetical protein